MKPIEKGAPVAFVPISPLLGNITVITLPASSPTPYAAMLYIDFVLSHDGQKVYHDTGRQVMHKDFLDPGQSDVKFVFPDADPNFPKRAQELTDMVETLFRF